MAMPASVSPISKVVVERVGDWWRHRRGFGGRESPRQLRLARGRGGPRRLEFHLKLLFRQGKRGCAFQDLEDGRGGRSVDLNKSLSSSCSLVPLRGPRVLEQSGRPRSQRLISSRGRRNIVEPFCENCFGGLDVLMQIARVAACRLGERWNFSSAFCGKRVRAWISASLGREAAP